MIERRYSFNYSQLFVFLSPGRGRCCRSFSLHPKETTSKIDSDLTTHGGGRLNATEDPLRTPAGTSPPAALDSHTWPDESLCRQIIKINTYQVHARLGVDAAQVHVSVKAHDSGGAEDAHRHGTCCLCFQRPRCLRGHGASTVVAPEAPEPPAAAAEKPQGPRRWTAVNGLGQRRRRLSGQVRC